MRGCARSCLLQLAAWAGLSAAFFLYLRTLGPVGMSAWPFSIAGGLLMAISLGYVGGIVKASRERTMLRDAMIGTRPPDGKWVAVSGEMRASSPVSAPFSGDQVAAYSYAIQRWEGSGKKATFATHFDGKAFAASTIATAQGVVRLLTVPELEMDRVLIPEAKAVENATAYIRSATFELRETGEQRVAALSREALDDDGVFRIDRRYGKTEVDLSAGFTLEERQVPQGARVCAFGVYSAERGGLVPDLRWGRTARLMLGNGEEAARQLGRRMRNYAFGAVLFAILFAVLVYNYHPPLQAT